MHNGLELYKRIANKETYAHQWNVLTDEERSQFLNFDDFKAYLYIMGGCAIEKRDYSRIKKLFKLTDATTFWHDVRKLTKNVESDHALHRWQCLAELRYQILKSY